MVLMKREDHEALLNELLNTELEHSRRTEILQQLRVDHSTGHAGFEEITKTNKKLQTDNEDLIVSNSKLFRQLGVTTPKEEKKIEEEEKSKTITIEDLERGVR